MAHILLLTQFFPPETGAAARRLKTLADELSTRHEIRVVTLKPSYPSSNLFGDTNLLDHDSDLGYPITRAFHFNPHTDSLILRGLREIVMSVRLAGIALNYPADIIIVTTPSMFLTPLAWLLTKIKKAKMVWDVRDLTWRYGRQSIQESGYRKVITAVLERLMILVMKRTDFVVGATPGVTRLLIEEHGVPAFKAATITNGVSRAFVEAFDQPPEPFQDPPCVMYLGLLGYNHGISVLVDVAHDLPQVRFLIVGDGPEKSKIEARMEELGVNNLSLKGYCTNEQEMVGMYHESDILVNHTKDRPVLNATVMPFKNFEYMATGKPFVYAGKGLAVDFLDPLECAEIAEPENPASIAAAIRRLLDNPERAHGMGKRGRDFVKNNYVREDLMGSYVAEIGDRIA